MAPLLCFMQLETAGQVQVQSSSPEILDHRGLTAQVHFWPQLASGPLYSVSQNRSRGQAQVQLGREVLFSLSAWRRGEGLPTASHKAEARGLAMSC